MSTVSVSAPQGTVEHAKLAQPAGMQCMVAGTVPQVSLAVELSRAADQFPRAIHQEAILPLRSCCVSATRTYIATAAAAASPAAGLWSVQLECICRVCGLGHHARE